MTKQMHKMLIGWSFCIFLRAIPFRIPNIEPILAFQLPFSKNGGPLIGFLFAFFNIIFFDILTTQLGAWTLITSLSYGLIGSISGYVFKRIQPTTRHYVFFSIIGTLIYDGITGLLVGPLLFNQPFYQACIGQIPFTLLHLIGNVTLVFSVSVLVDRWIVDNKYFECSL